MNHNKIQLNQNVNRPTKNEEKSYINANTKPKKENNSSRLINVKVSKLIIQSNNPIASTRQTYKETMDEFYEISRQYDLDMKKAGSHRNQNKDQISPKSI